MVLEMVVGRGIRLTLQGSTLRINGDSHPHHRAVIVSGCCWSRMGARTPALRRSVSLCESL